MTEMNSKLPLVKNFCELIDKGSQTLATLCDLSEQEKQAIETINASELQSCVKQKQQQLELLADNTLQRNQILVALGFSTDMQGLQGLQDSLPPAIAKQVIKRWNLLSEQLQKAADLNHRNEQIVQRSQRNLSNLLSIMQGQSPKNTLYDDAGHKGNYSGQNTLGKA